MKGFIKDAYYEEAKLEHTSGASSCISRHSFSISWFMKASCLSYLSRQQLSKIESSIPQYSKSPWKKSSFTFNRNSGGLLDVA